MGIMRIFLHGISSFSYWLTAQLNPRAGETVSAQALRDCEPTLKSLKHLSGCLPFVPRPYQVTTPSEERRVPANVVRHVCVKRPKGKAFCRVADGVYVSSPELCFIQLGCALSFHELVRAGSVLCGCFRIDPSENGKLRERSRLTTKRRMEAFVRANPGLPGIKNVRRALPWLVEGAASPPEVFLAMVLGMPFRFGGFQVEGLMANRRLVPTQKAQALARRATLVPDLLLPDTRLAIEYDSTAEHASSRQLSRDAQKRLALEADGYKVVTVTTRQLADRAALRGIAEQIYEHVGRRLRPQSQFFDARQAQLFQMGWSLDDCYTQCVSENEGTGMG